MRNISIPQINLNSPASFLASDGTIKDLGDTLVAQIAQLAGLKPSNQQIRLSSHFVELFGPLVADNSNGGGLNVDSGSFIPGAIGSWDVKTGTNNNGQSAARSSTRQIVFGLGQTSLAWRVQLDALSDGTNTYTVYVGMTSAITATPGDGVFLRYTHSVNGGRWQLVAVNDGVETAVDTGVTAVAGAWVYFTIVVAADGATAAVYFGSSATAASANVTGVPNGSVFRAVDISANIIKSAGTNERHLYLDYFSFAVDLTTSL